MRAGGGGGEEERKEKPEPNNTKLAILTNLNYSLNQTIFLRKILA